MFIILYHYKSLLGVRWKVFSNDIVESLAKHHLYLDLSLWLLPILCQYKKKLLYAILAFAINSWKCK